MYCHVNIDSCIKFHGEKKCVFKINNLCLENDTVVFLAHLMSVT